MARKAQGPAPTDSQRWLQRLVNDDPGAINGEIASQLGLESPEQVTWLSPLREDSLAEYGDGEFLDRLGVGLERRPRREFWPARGRCGTVWPGPAGATCSSSRPRRTSPRSSPPPSAAGQASLDRIARSPEETRSFLNARSEHPWTGTFYQYTNRLAHLYLLREMNRLPAWLVLVCFVGAEEVRGPANEDEWRGALKLLDTYLGLGRHRLSPFVVHVFPDVRGA